MTNKEGYIYISCLENEQDLPQVLELRQWLVSNGCSFVFDSTRYQGIAFKEYAAVVVVAGCGHAHSSWLPNELYDALYLSKSRADGRPFFFGLKIDGAVPPPCTQDIPIHWLDLEQNYLYAEQSYIELLSGAKGEQYTA